MILKIQDAKILRKWHYKDNITDLSFNYSEYTINGDHQIFSKEEEIKFDHMTTTYIIFPSCIENIIVADFIKNNCSGCIAFNTKAYLLSDDGKIIERINY